MNFFQCVKVFLWVMFSLALAGCGGGSSSGGNNPSPTITLASGNWSVHANSQVLTPGTTVYIGGNLTEVGTTVAAVMHIANSSCFDITVSIPFSGSATSSNALTVTSGSVAGQVISVTGTISTTNTFSGTYSISGGCANGDHGTISATLVPSLSGTWSAASSGSLSLASIALTQAALAPQGGTFPLSGTISYANPSPCYKSGTVDAGTSFVAGDIVVIDANMVDLNNVANQLSFIGLLNNPAAPTSIAGSYNYVGNLCTGFNVALTLTKN